MPYLDVSPMITAFQTTPEAFEFSQGWLHHRPSDHAFHFQDNGRVRLRAECRCAVLDIEPAQEAELVACFRQWRANYWTPLEINREFASHFRRSPLRQLLIDLTGWLHNRLVMGPKHGADADTVAVPAE